jgi:hypothetical protein
VAAPSKAPPAVELALLGAQPTALKLTAQKRIITIAAAKNFLRFTWPSAMSGFSIMLLSSSYLYFIFCQYCQMKNPRRGLFQKS